MDEAVHEGLDSLLISGGEPTIHRDIIGIVKEASARFRRVSIASNGIRFAKRDFLHEILEAGLNEINIPLYSLREEIFDWLVQHRGAFKSVMRGIKNVFDAKREFEFQVYLKLLIMKPNYKENPRIARWIMKNYPNVKAISISGLRVGEKACRRREELYVPFNVAKPYITKTIREIPFDKLLIYDYVPLCSIDSQLVFELIESGKLKKHDDTVRLARPDLMTFELREPYHCEPCCLECDVEEYCPKVHFKNAEKLGYDKQLKALVYDGKKKSMLKVKG